MNDRRFPWLILVPRRSGLVEVTDLGPDDRYLLMDEIALCMDALRAAVPENDKINVAALGNMVRQLHVHVIARQTSDVAWPNPVWSAGGPEPYDPAHSAERRAALESALKS